MTDDLLIQKFEALTLAVQQQQQVNQALLARLNDLKAVFDAQASTMEKLGAVQGLEWIEELKAWVSQAKWQALRSHPLDQPASEKPAK